MRPQRELDRVSGFTDAPAGAAMEALLRRPRPPTAVFAANDMAALGAMEAAVRLGVRVPDDLSIIGYDDIPLARYLTPPLTTIRVPVHDFGRESARILVDQIERGQPSAERVTFDPQLVVRASTALAQATSASA